MPNQPQRAEPFPVPWDDWRPLWQAWLARQLEHGTFAPTAWRFPGKNFLADEILGTWSVAGRNVELSEVTFPSLEPGTRGERRRYVGVTFGTGAGADSGPVVGTFVELEQALGLLELQCGHTAPEPGPAGAPTGRVWCLVCQQSVAIVDEQGRT